jgi:hypothetical protein
MYSVDAALFFCIGAARAPLLQSPRNASANVIIQSGKF